MNSNKPLVILIEDDPQIRRLLNVALPSQGFDFLESASGKEGITQVAMRNPDIIILDLGLPDMDGIEVIRQIREWSAIPIIVLSARGQEQDKISALDNGADDYLTKPFGMGELVARLRVSLRHAMQVASDAPASSVFTLGELKVDLAARRVWKASTEMHLTPIEYKLLTMLIRYAGKVLTHRQLLKEVWGPNFVAQTQYLRVFMGQLRSKIENDPARPRYLMTEIGVGYRLRVDEV